MQLIGNPSQQFSVRNFRARNFRGQEFSRKEFLWSGIFGSGIFSQEVSGQEFLGNHYTSISFHTQAENAKKNLPCMLSNISKITGSFNIISHFFSCNSISRSFFFFNSHYVKVWNIVRARACTNELLTYQNLVMHYCSCCSIYSIYTPLQKCRLKGAIKRYFQIIFKNKSKKCPKFFF